MELLVVVAILAIVAGLVTVAYDGLVGQAAKGTSANAIASLTNSVSIYQVTERKLPGNLDTLLAVTPNGANWSATEFDNTTVAYSPGATLVSALHPSLRGKLAVRQLTATEKDNLKDAGVTRVRYVDVLGNANAAPATLTIRAAGGTPATVGPVALMDIPSHLFDVPMDLPSANRGRGFALDLTGTALPELAFLSPGTSGYEYLKLGVQTSAALVVLGVGKNSSLIQAGAAATGTATNARLSSAPFYGDVGKAEYPNYLLVIDVSVRPARFITVIDPKGGFLAENYAGGRGQ